MISFVVWFSVLALLGLFTRGWTRGILIALYIVGSFLAVL